MIDRTTVLAGLSYVLRNKAVILASQIVSRYVVCYTFKVISLNT